MVSVPTDPSPSRIGHQCIFCRKPIDPPEVPLKIAGVLLAHESCANQPPLD